MNRREKLLMIAIGSAIGLAVVYGLVNSLLLKPRAALHRSIAERGKELTELQGKAGREIRFREQHEDFLKRTYLGGYDPDGKATQEAAQRRLKALALAAGLEEKTLDIRPQSIGREGIKHGFLHVGLTATVNGSLQAVTDFLYLLRAEPVPHRIESLRLRPDLAAGQVEVWLRYTTLAMLPPSGDPPSAATRPTTQPRPVPPLDDPARRAFDAIASRDLFRPFVARPAPTPPPTPVGRNDPPRHQPPPSTDQYYRIVGLSTWSGDAADAVIVVTDSRTRHTAEHLVGDKLGDGTIACVDYRPLPTPGDPEILSPSRAILKIGERYYAVELGQTLAEKRVLTESDLPDTLRDGVGAADSAETSPAQAG
ncbi:MAG: hypothetical protein GX591_12525 [Planctomycetes bacterium]|nr:hypothetical protein [Planctomycetota bacterium]